MRQDQYIEHRALDDWGPFFMEAAIYPDIEAKPTDYECYTPEQIEAWKRDEWHFVGIVVEVRFEGRVVGEDSLWGLEYGLDGYNPLDDPERWADVVHGAKMDTQRWISKVKEIAA
jgi:hypothetical protein